MEIAITELKPGANHFEVAEDWQTLELANSIFPEPINVSSLADLEGRLLTWHHHLETTAHLVCDRCLQEFNRQIDLRDRFIYAIDPLTEYDDDVTVVKSEDQFINLNANLREMLLLAIPLQKLCREDCRGLCPVCGGDLNQTDCDCQQTVESGLQAELTKLKRRK